MSKASKRIYAVRQQSTGTNYLVIAGSPAQVRSHLARHEYVVVPANGIAVAHLMSQGVKVTHVSDAHAQQDIPGLPGSPE